MHELATLFPPMTDEEFAGLKDDIARNGVHQPVAVWREQVIDGRHQYQACHDLGIEAPLRHLDDDADPVSFVLSANMSRRQLSPSQKAIITAQLPLVVNGSNQYTVESGGVKVGTKFFVPHSQEQRALWAGITPRYQSDADGIVKDGAPDIIEKVRNGDITVNDAIVVVRAQRKTKAAAKKAEKERREAEEKAKAEKEAAEKAKAEREATILEAAIERVEDAQARGKPITLQEAVKAIRREMVRAEWEQQQEEMRNADPLDAVQLILSPCADLHQQVEAESVDIILTDPPYKPATLDVYKDLAEFAVHALKPGGVLLAMAGTSHLPDVLQYLCNTEGLNYHWTLNYMMPGGNLRFHTRAVRMGWKPVIWMVKGESDGTDRFDVVEAPRLAVQDTRFHEWGQNEGGFEKLLDLFGFPGQMVCDPFLGGGTTALIARRKGCGFIGADVDAQYLKITAERLRDDPSCQ
jgi:site-specific DNA-methyltransferase (adenine-specific)